MNDFSSKGKRLIAAVLVLYIVLSLIGFWMADEQKLIDIFEDDAYYYFTIAKNIRDGRGLTFDGQTITNGFHPLWLLTLLPVFLIVKDPILVLRCVGTVSTLLTGYAVFLALRVLYKYRFVVFLISTVFFTISIASISNTGMETAILIPLLLVTFGILEKRENQREKTMVIGGYLALALLARLDAVFLVFIVALFSVVESRRNLWIAGVPGIVLGMYLSANWLITGHLMPTSGAAKSLNTPGQLYNPKFLHQLITPNNPVDGNLWVIYSLAFLVSCGLVCTFLLDTVRTRSFKALKINRVPFAVASFFVVYTMYYLFRTSWVLWRWYTYPLVLFSVFVLPFLIEHGFNRFEPYRFQSRTFKTLLGGVSLFLIVSVTIIAVKFGGWVYFSQPSFKYPNYLAAQRLNDRLSSQVTLAMGDRAGSLAYFFDGGVLQLEGLLADYELLHAIETDSLMVYMDEFGVDYVVSYTKPPSSYVKWELRSPLPKLTSGSSAAMLLCKESEFVEIDSQTLGLSIWRWPSCSD
jgi:hypothetical protein